jgi:3-methyl-2-oxobutanoate hydroxymethyltransferase
VKIRTKTLTEMKQRGELIVALTSYDSLTAKIFDSAGIHVLLVGDSAANTMLGYSTTLPITLAEMIPFARAVASSSSRALVVADLPFGSYESGVEQALASAVQVMKETGVAAVKLEGGVERVPQVEALVSSGIPVMGHLGFTPQSVHQFGGFRVQGRGDAAEKLRTDAAALQAAGCFAIVLEMIPRQLAGEVTRSLQIPTIGIGAGDATDGQILVWTDMAGMESEVPKFVRQFENLGVRLAEAAVAYRTAVVSREFPAAENSFD